MINHQLLTNSTYKKLSYTILLLIFLVASPLFFWRGIGVFDDSVYLKIGELITDGLLPYKDVFDNKPPGIYYVAAIIAWVSNKHWLTNRVFLFIFPILVGYVIIKYTKSLWNNQVAYFSALLFPISYVISQGYSFHTEQFCAAFGFLSLLLITNDRKFKMINWFLSGCCLGLAFMFKQVGIIYLISFFISDLLFLYLGKLSFINALRRCLFLILGFCIVTCSVFTLIFLNGYWSNFYNDVFVGVLPFAEKEINILSIIKFWIKTPISLLFIPLTLLMCINSKCLRNITLSKHFYEFILLFSMGFLSLLPTIKVNSNTHYIGAAVIALSIIEAILIDNLLQSLLEKSAQKKNIFRYINLGKIAKKSSYIVTLLLLPYILGILWVSKTMIVENRIVYDLSQMSEIRTIINKYTPPKTPVLVLSTTAPRLYYMSGRLPYMKYIYYYFNTKIQINDAAKMLLTSDVPISILELPSNNQIDWLSSKDILELKQKYLNIEVASPSSSHLSGNKVKILINRKFVK